MIVPQAIYTFLKQPIKSKKKHLQIGDSSAFSGDRRVAASLRQPDLIQARGHEGSVLQQFSGASGMRPQVKLRDGNSHGLLFFGSAHCWL